MAVNTIASPALASVTNRPGRTELSVIRRWRRAVDGPPAATYSDRMHDASVAARIDADRVMVETWGWS
jgi:hypothetical protein